MASADDERRQQRPRAVRQRRRPTAHRGTTLADIDHDRLERPEGLFTELESAMDAASAHLLSAEAIVDATSPFDAKVIDRMVSSFSIVIIMPSSSDNVGLVKAICFQTVCPPR